MVYMSIHAHKILKMMAGNEYTEAQLVVAIQEQFGEDAVFHTCSAKDMNAQAIVDFLKNKGKFRLFAGERFTVDESNVCDHE